MCGIAGLMSRTGGEPDIALLDRMLSAIAHRGPDGEGKHVAGSVAMGQTRLAIIDLVTGDQPLYEPGGAALVANGEVYNYLELRRDLDGVPFSSGSDCEPPLHLYRRMGLAFADKLRGMYAIAIHDPAENLLVLTRDPFGIKPLYYVETDQLFAFASEPQALQAAGLGGSGLNPVAERELMQLQFTCGSSTIHPGIRRVLPGETLVIRAGRVIERRRRAALPEAGPRSLGDEEGLKELDRVLMESVDLHQRSDVPYGLFLSGGIDSTALLAVMSRLNERPVVAFTAGFSDAQGAVDERGLARAVAQRFGADHHEAVFGEADFLTDLPKIIACIDDPTADYAILPTWKLAKLAAQTHGLKVVLCGEGGDELFAGYGRHRAVTRPWFLGGKTGWSKGIFDGLGVLRDESPAWRDAVGAAEAVSRMRGRNRLQTAQAVDVCDWLPNDLLVKLDRCLMAHGLEGRTPFLDPVVADFAFRLPDRLKIRDRRGKWLLRRWLADQAPEARPFDRKRGFTVPVGDWIAARGARLADLLSRQPDIARLARADRLQALFTSGEKRARFAAWVLLFHAVWCQTRIHGADPQGDLESVLAHG